MPLDNAVPRSESAEQDRLFQFVAVDQSRTRYAPSDQANADLVFILTRSASTVEFAPIACTAQPADALAVVIVAPIADHGKTIGESNRMAFNPRFRTMLTDMSGIFGTSALIGVDLLDVRTALDHRICAIGFGQTTGARRAIYAAKKALADLAAQGLKAHMISGAALMIAGPASMRLQEVADVMNVIHASTRPEADIVSGAYIDTELTDDLRVCLLASAANSAD